MQIGARTVQGELERALARLSAGRRVRVDGAGRTDAGVHARGQVIAFTYTGRLSRAELGRALAALLPRDIGLGPLRRVHPGFKPRYRAKWREYRYFIWNQASMNPLHRKTAWHVPLKLDLPLMRQAARQFVGKHDFRSFAANRNYETEDTLRNLFKCQIQKKGPLMTVIIQGDGFLYKMCRGIAGTLVQIGQHKIELADLRAIFESKKRSAAGMTAPAHGLVLWKVFY